MQIIPFHRDHAADFKHLNQAWIEQYFAMEPFDHEVLGKPEEYILARGGEVWFVEEAGHILGACALLKLNDSMYEFSKLGVAEQARGRGVARLLLRHCIARARELGSPILRIYTNSKLIPANTLYRSEGFVEVEMRAEDRARYRRVDIMYDMPLAAASAQRA